MRGGAGLAGPSGGKEGAPKRCGGGPAPSARPLPDEGGLFPGGRPSADALATDGSGLVFAHSTGIQPILDGAQRTARLSYSIGLGIRTVTLPLRAARSAVRSNFSRGVPGWSATRAKACKAHRASKLPSASRSRSRSAPRRGATVLGPNAGSSSSAANIRISGGGNLSKDVLIYLTIKLSRIGDRAADGWLPEAPGPSLWSCCYRYTTGLARFRIDLVHFRMPQRNHSRAAANTTGNDAITPMAANDSRVLIMRSPMFASAVVAQDKVLSRARIGLNSGGSRGK